MILQIVYYSLLTFLNKSFESNQLASTKFQVIKATNSSTVYSESFNYPNNLIEKSTSYNDDELAKRMDSYKAVAEILQYFKYNIYYIQIMILYFTFTFI